MRNLEIYTDGSHHEDGVIGFGAVIVAGAEIRELRYAAGTTTNANRCGSSIAELLAIQMALRAIDRPATRVAVYTDSRGTRNILLNEESAGGAHWRLVQMVRRLLAECLAAEIHWLRGHSGHPHNERAHRLCGQAVREYQQQRQSGRPGRPAAGNRSQR